MVDLSIITLGPYVSGPASVHMLLDAVYPPEVGCMELAPSYQVEESVATRTDVGLAYVARALAEGLAFKIVAFQVGASGYDPVFFGRPLPVVDGSRVGAVVYEGPVEWQTASSDGTLISFTCRIPAEVRSILGEVALVAEVLSSPLSPSEVGTRFQFAVGHCPAVVKHRLAASTFRFVVSG